MAQEISFYLWNMVKHFKINTLTSAHSLNTASTLSHRRTGSTHRRSFLFSSVEQRRKEKNRIPWIRRQKDFYSKQPCVLLFTICLIDYYNSTMASRENVRDTFCFVQTAQYGSGTGWVGNASGTQTAVSMLNYISWLDVFLADFIRVIICANLQRVTVHRHFHCAHYFTVTLCIRVNYLWIFLVAMICIVYAETE